MQFYELKILFLLRKLLSLPQILANSMSKTIVNIITEDNPIPAYLFIKEKYEDGDNLMYISAKDTEDDLDALSELFNVPATHIEEIVLKNDMDEFTYEKICRTVLGRLKRGINYCVNLAGGTRYMALAIQQVFEQFKAEFFYVQVEENLLVKSLFDDSIFNNDDYFYPTTEGWFDAGIYVEQGIDIPLNRWRTENCDKMVRAIYEAVKRENPTVEFGIAPQGNIENNYNYLFADVKRWLCEDGYCDYLVPQIYYGYENSVKPYLETLREWREIDKDKPLIIGLAAYKVGTEDDFSYDTGILSKQAEDAMKNGCQGYALYNYISLFDGSQRMGDETRLLSQL